MSMRTSAPEALGTNADFLNEFQGMRASERLKPNPALQASTSSFIHVSQEASQSSEISLPNDEEVGGNYDDSSQSEPLPRPFPLSSGKAAGLFKGGRSDYRGSDNERMEVENGDDEESQENPACECLFLQSRLA